MMATTQLYSCSSSSCCVLLKFVSLNAVAISLLVLVFLLFVARLCAVYIIIWEVRRQCDVGEYVTSRSNVLYDVEPCLQGETLEDVRSFLRDTRRLDLAVNTYGNYKVLACQR